MSILYALLKVEILLEDYSLALQGLSDTSISAVYFHKAQDLLKLINNLYKDVPSNHQRISKLFTIGAATHTKSRPRVQI